MPLNNGSTTPDEGIKAILVDTDIAQQSLCACIETPQGSASTGAILSTSLVNSRQGRIYLVRHERLSSRIWDLDYDDDEEEDAAVNPNPMNHDITIENTAPETSDVVETLDLYSVSSRSPQDATDSSFSAFRQLQIYFLAGYFLLNWNFAALNLLPACVNVILDNGMVFPIETDLLQHTSVYFFGLFRYNNNWLESRSGVVRLQNVESDAFAVYQQWLDTGSIDDHSVMSQQNHQPGGQEETTDHKHDLVEKNEGVVFGNKNETFETDLDGRLDLLTHCYLLGDYIGAIAFQNDVIDEISHVYCNLHNTNSSIPLHNVSYICNKSTAENPLRHFVVDAVRCGLSKKTLAEAAELGLIPLDVAVAIAGDAMADMDVPWSAPYRCLPWLSSPCTFHVHPKGDFNCPCLDPFSTNGREKVWDVKPWEQDFIGNEKW